MKLKYLFFLLCAIFTFAITYNVNALSVAKVNPTGGINLKTGPGTNYKTDGRAGYLDAVTILNNKTVKGKGCSDGWYKINYNGLIRYVCADEVSAATRTAKLNVKNNFSVRNGAGTNYKVHKNLSKDTTVILAGAKVYNKSSSCTKGWYKIIIDRSWNKYVCANYTKNYTANSITTVTQTGGTYLRTSTTTKKNYAKMKYGTSLTLDRTSKYKGTKGCSKGWYKVNYKGKKLYICSSSTAVTNSNGVVTSPSGLTIRAKASSSSKKIANIGYTEKLMILSGSKYKGSGCSAGWYKVYVQGKTSYACSNYVSKSTWIANTNTNVSIKSSNNSSSSTIGTLGSNRSVILLALNKYQGNGCSKGWYKVSFDGRSGYVCSSQTNFDSGYAITKTSTNTNTNTNSNKNTSTKTSTSTTNGAITRTNTNKGFYNTIKNWTYRVNEDYAYTRSSPTGSIQDTVYLGTELTYLGTSKATSNCSAGWYKVKYFSKKTGYICKTYVDKYSDVTRNDNSYCTTLKNKGFPSSYCPYLSYIHSKHPNWIFKPEKTGVSFLAAVNGESRKNYTQNTRGAYLYSWSIAEAGGWRVANDAYVGFMIDPRSYINEKNIFAFEDLGYDKNNHTKTVVRSILKGSWLDTDTYAGYFVNAGKNNKVSPIHLAARVKQEGGSNSSYAGVSGNVSTKWRVLDSTYICAANVNVSGNSISVKNGINTEVRAGAATNSKTPTYPNGNKIKVNNADTLTFINKTKYKSAKGCTSGWYKVKVDKSLKGIYNFYNIGAYGSNPVVRGIAAAAGYVDYLDGTPWNTREKAINNGAKFISAGYISKGQDTLFYQKFNTGPNNYFAKYTHQYMTNILAPASESLSTYRSYSNMKILDKAYTFKIPVFNSMPGNMTTHPVVK